MENNGELHARLAELDQELEEGEITTKGYQKRRTFLLDQFRGYGTTDGSRTASISSNAHMSMQQPAAAAASPGPPPHTQRGYNPDSPRLTRQSLTPSYTSMQHDRNDTMGTLVSGFSPGLAAHGVGIQGRSVSQPAQSQQWHVRNGSYHSTAQPGSPQSRHASFSYNQQSQSAYIQQGIVPDHQRQYSSNSIGQQIPQQIPTQYNNGDGYNNYYNQGQQTPQPGLYGYGDARAQTMQDSGYEHANTMTGYFADFPTQGYDAAGNPAIRPDSYGTAPAQYVNRYSQNPDYPPYSPAAAFAPPLLNSSDLPLATNHQLPLEPRQVPFDVYDPHNGNIPMSKFDNIASVLRHRMQNNAKLPAYLVLDSKGKETATITWEKLGARAEKVAQIIRDKSNLYRGDRVALIYREIEVIEFAVALLGCFLAGVVAVPVNNPEDHNKLNLILQQTQAHLALTTDNNLKAFQRDLTTHKLQWPRGVEWWKTNEFGMLHPKKKDDSAALQVPDLAYIEFAKDPTGDLRGVVMDHRTIMHQMSCLSAIIKTATSHESTKDTFSSALRDKSGKLMNPGTGEVLVTYLDPRQSIGMIFGVLLGVYGGHTTVYVSHQSITTPGLYANIITKYRATLTLADYPGLKTVAYNYQADPFQTRNFSKKVQVDFSQMKLCFIDCLTVDSEFHDILTDRWLRPLGNPRARDVVAPMLCLPEHGGMVIAVRDWLGGEDRMGVPLVAETLTGPGTPEATKEKSSTGAYSGLIGNNDNTKMEEPGVNKQSDLLEALIDREALKTNEILLIAVGTEAKKRAGEPGTVRLTAFGYPLADATLAIVDPENSVLCASNVVGEIWVDSPSLSGGFWNSPKQTDTIFHARPYKFNTGSPLPVLLDMEFLRTGLLGCVIEGKVFVLGLYEDRLRQQMEWSHTVWTDGTTDNQNDRSSTYRYFFVQHLIVSIIKNVPKIYDSSAFDIFVNDEHLPIVLLESSAASTSPSAAGGPPRQLDTALLDSISEKCMEVLLEEHQVRVYCVMITAPNTLPRTWKNGRREIGNMLCRKDFEIGALPCVHVKFGVERAVLNLPIGIDPVGGIWSELAMFSRQDICGQNEKQYSGLDHREVVIDDKTNVPLNDFTSIVDLLQYRVMKQEGELSYCTIDGRGKQGKDVTWKKLDLKIAAVAAYLKRKGLKAGDHIILIFTHSEDFVYAIHACFCMGIVAIPMAPLDQNRLSEDVPALLHIITDFKVRAILVNNDVEALMKQKPLAQHIKQSASVLKVVMPTTYNTSKPPKQNSGCRDLGFKVRTEWTQPNFTALVWTYWTPDQRRIAVSLGHDTILGICKVQKETCQMPSSRPVLGCVRSTNGLGFVHSCIMGIYVGAPTYLVSPVDFGSNPLLLFLALSRYKIKDTYATPQMLDHAVSLMNGKGLNLVELKNMMITFEGRPRSDLFEKVKSHFVGSYLDPTAINTIYSHVLNPMVASRSYMCIEPIELYLDTKSLRRGLVYPVDPDIDPDTRPLRVQDSGMVPVSTQIAIVNPETCLLCHVGEYGEIWVDSEACAKSFYGSKDAFDAERFNGKTLDGDPRVTYVRTGDLGFLHSVSRPIGPGGAEVEMQTLFVLGQIGETFEVTGLSHFPIDIEASIERCHRNIVLGGSAVFQAGGLVVVLIEVFRKSFLASIVPVIVNAILNEHQLVVDIVAFVGNGDFPRSRLGEKQRGKILASWVTRKLHTIAQFGIRDTDDAPHRILDERMLSPGPGSAHIPASIKSANNSFLDTLVHTPESENAPVEAPTHTFSQYADYDNPNSFAVELPTSYNDIHERASHGGASSTESSHRPTTGSTTAPLSNHNTDNGDTSAPPVIPPMSPRRTSILSSVDFVFNTGRSESPSNDIPASIALPPLPSHTDMFTNEDDVITPKPHDGSKGHQRNLSLSPESAPILGHQRTVSGASANSQFSVGSFAKEAVLYDSLAKGERDMI